jgi:hypothetical protein
VQSVDARKRREYGEYNLNFDKYKQEEPIAQANLKVKSIKR